MSKLHTPKTNLSSKPVFSTKNLSYIGNKDVIKAEFQIRGMTCGNCVAHVEKALNGQKGIINAHANLKKSKVSVEYIPDLITPTKMQEVVNEAGYDLIINEDRKNNTLESDISTQEDSSSDNTDNQHTENSQYPVIGMTCASCAAHVRRTILQQDGVKKASVNLANNTAYIQYIPEIATPQAIKKAVQNSGYDLIIEKKDNNEIQLLHREEYNKLKKNCLIALSLALPLSIIAMFFHDISYANYIMWALATPIVFISGAPFFTNAYRQAKHLTSNMDTLVALSSGIAYLFSAFNTLFPSVWINIDLEPHVYFEVSGIVIAFVLLGRLLESRAKLSTTNAIQTLIGIQPKTAIVTRNNKTIDIPIEDIALTDIIVARPGDKIAVDGSIIMGNSYIDQSMITGEPLPVEKSIGDKVFSGTINQSGNIHYKAEKIGKDTLLAQIIKTVQEAQGSRAPIQNTVDRIASFFVPSIILIAIITLLAWCWLGQDNPFSQGLLSAITVLIIACPCALGLATPTAIMVGIGRGATMGILIKDAEALEEGKKITSVVLDKTGTITKGRPQVAKIEWHKTPDAKIKDILFSIEKNSDHPLAYAISSFLRDEAQLITDIEVHNIPGFGLKAEYNSEIFYVGNGRFMTDQKIEISADTLNLIDKWEKEGYTVITFSNDKKTIAILAITDKIRDTSATAIQELQSMGLTVHMLTGDNEKAARKIAKDVGIDIVRANVLPTDKANYIKQLHKKGEKVAMIGDGINDSAALANADLSIAMGKGSDIAIEVAQVTIISSDLKYLPKAIRLSKSTVNTIHQNLFWAFIYNIIGIPLAAGILYPINGFLLNPMIAGAAMALSSVCVVTNSLLLNFKKI